MEPPSTVRVSILNSTGTRVPAQRIRQSVRTALLRSGISRGRVSILITDDTEQRRLNREFREIDASTDVLTFPAGPVPGSSFSGDPLLGDISISLPYAERQARQRGVGVDEEVCSLAIHGALHIAGFDDEAEDDQRAMQAEMAATAAELGLPAEPAWMTLDLAAAGTI